MRACLLLVPLALAFAACGDNVSGGGGGGNGGGNGTGNGNGSGSGSGIITGTDSGTSTFNACEGPAPICPGDGCGNVVFAQCTNGGWFCPPPPPCLPPEDAGFPDVISIADAGIAETGPQGGVVQCGPGLGCATDSFYCEAATGGASNMTTYSCKFYPMQCEANPDCTCMEMALGCSCMEQGPGALVLSCALP